MKKTLLFFTLILVTISNAQDPELIDNEWFLSHIILEGTTHAFPFMNPIDSNNANINFESNEFFADIEIDVFTGSINYSNTNEFILTDMITSLGGCEFFCEFENHYFTLLLGDGNENAFTYNITILEGVKTLTITSQDGNIAVFNDTSMIEPNPELLNTTWYLQNLILDGEDNIPSNIGQSLEISFNFDENEDAFMFNFDNDIGLCTYETRYQSGDQFLFDYGICLAEGVCNNGTGGEACYDFFQNGYNSFYEGYIHSLFNYQIRLETDGSKSLIITNPEGNQAIYNTTELILSINDINKLNFTIFPNPTNDQIFVSSENLEIETFIIYDITGKQIVSQENKNNTIDVLNLKSGVYFLEVNSNEEKAIERFIKN